MDERNRFYDSTHDAVAEAVYAGFLARIELGKGMTFDGGDLVYELGDDARVMRLEASPVIDSHRTVGEGIARVEERTGIEYDPMLVVAKLDEVGRREFPIMSDMIRKSLERRRKLLEEN